MILTKINENPLLDTSSTKEGSATEYKFIATHGTTNNTIEVSGSVTISTPRFDRIPLELSGAVQDIGYWDYLLVKQEFAGSYGDVNDIQLGDDKEFIVEVGKMLVTNEAGKIPSKVYSGKQTQRVTYNG